MLFAAINELQFHPLNAIITFLAFVTALVIAVTVHEFSHALAANRLGDFTAQRLQRLTLNPRAHLDPMGTILILLGGFGWGKPTPVDPMNLDIGIRPGMAVVSLAGPISNVIVAAMFALPLRTGLVEGDTASFALFSLQPYGVVGFLLGSIVFWNLLLAAFNLLPMAPLDGFNFALGMLPEKRAESFAKTERHGMMILILLIMIDAVLPFGILWRIIGPIVELLRFVVLGG